MCQTWWCVLKFDVTMLCHRVSKIWCANNMRKFFSQKWLECYLGSCQLITSVTVPLMDLSLAYWFWKMIEYLCLVFIHQLIGSLIDLLLAEWATWLMTPLITWSTRSCQCPLVADSRGGASWRALPGSTDRLSLLSLFLHHKLEPSAAVPVTKWRVRPLPSPDMWCISVAYYIWHDPFMLGHKTCACSSL